jgi:hypothetical protein
MARFKNSLKNVRVAAPCTANWELMIGNDRSRFCGQCKLNVYNLSGMTRSEAESLIAQSEGRLCVRFYRRADGSILTENCPVGLRALRRRIASVYKAIASAALSFLAGLGFYQALSALTILNRPAPLVTMGTVRMPQSLPVLPGPATVGVVARPMEMGKMAIRKSDEVPAYLLQQKSHKPSR